jgi:thioredoxin 1
MIQAALFGFMEVVALGKPVLMDFFAEWCGPCRMQTPIMHELEADFEGKAEIKKIDVDKAGELATKYNIMVVPTIILEKDGVELNRWMGITSRQELSKAINNALK